MAYFHMSSIWLTSNMSSGLAYFYYKSFNPSFSLLSEFVYSSI